MEGGTASRTVWIERSKVYPAPGSNPRYQWRWIYRLRCEGFTGPTWTMPDGRSGAVSFEGQTLSTIRQTAAKIAREHGAAVREAWKEG